MGILIDCKNPNDYKEVANAVEAAIGKCSITYSKQAEEMIKKGIAKSRYSAAKIIAEEEGASFATINGRIYKGLRERGMYVPRKHGASHAAERDKAVAMVRSKQKTGMSIAEACRVIGKKLGCNPYTVQGWVYKPRRDTTELTDKQKIKKYKHRAYILEAEKKSYLSALKEKSSQLAKCQKALVTAKKRIAELEEELMYGVVAA